MIHNLATLKIRSKPMATFFGVCLKDLITQHKDNINVLMKSTIFNELGLQVSYRTVDRSSWPLFSLAQILFVINIHSRTPQSAALGTSAKNCSIQKTAVLGGLLVIT